MNIGLHKIQLSRCSQDTRSQKKHTSEQGCEFFASRQSGERESKHKDEAYFGSGVFFLYSLSVCLSWTSQMLGKSNK